MTVGLIAGGINTNVVPDKVTFRLDRRIIPEENPLEVEATPDAADRSCGGEVARRRLHRPPHSARQSFPAGSRARTGWSPQSRAMRRV